MRFVCFKLNKECSRNKKMIFVKYWGKIIEYIFLGLLFLKEIIKLVIGRYI